MAPFTRYLISLLCIACSKVSSSLRDCLGHTHDSALLYLTVDYTFGPIAESHFHLYLLLWFLLDLLRTSQSIKKNVRFFTTPGPAEKSPRKTGLLNKRERERILCAAAFA